MINCTWHGWHFWETPPCLLHARDLTYSSSSLAGVDYRHSESVTVIMAPQYAPSLRSRFPLVAFLLETVFILLFVFFVKIEQHEQIDRESDSKLFIRSYAG